MTLVFTSHSAPASKGRGPAVNEKATVVCSKAYRRRGPAVRRREGKKDVMACAADDLGSAWRPREQEDRKGE